MPIALTRAQIDVAMPKIAEGLRKYLWLQRCTTVPGFHQDAEFQKRFSGFYRVRRNHQWRRAFFALMLPAQIEQLAFGSVLELLVEVTSRYEASFSSKMFATFNPTAPVIDSVVLKNLGRRIPSPQTPNRIAATVALHLHMAQLFSEYLAKSDGKYLVRRFDDTFPEAADAVTSEKKLDLVLWQCRN